MAPSVFEGPVGPWLLPNGLSFWAYPFTGRNNPAMSPPQRNEGAKEETKLIVAGIDPGVMNDACMHHPHLPWSPHRQHSHEQWGLL
jgi:hypothetical protein